MSAIWLLALVYVIGVGCVFAMKKIQPTNKEYKWLVAVICALITIFVFVYGLQG